MLVPIGSVEGAGVLRSGSRRRAVMAANPASGTKNPLTPTAPNLSNLSNLGVTEQKQAPPDKNPLENTGDNFLEGLE